MKKIIMLATIAALSASCSQYAPSQQVGSQQIAPPIVVLDNSEIKNFIEAYPIHIPRFNSTGEIKITAEGGLLWQCVLTKAVGSEVPEYCDARADEISKNLGDTDTHRQHFLGFKKK